MSWLSRRAALVVAIAWSLGAAAGTAFADRDLTAGMELYEALDYEKAQDRLEAALKDESLASGDIGQAAMYLGLVHYNLGNTVAAESYFGIALTFDESLQLPGGTSPKIGDTFDAIRKLVFPAPRLADAGTVKRAVEQPDPDGGPGENREPVDDAFPWGTLSSGAATVITGGIAIYFALEARATKNTIQDTPHAREQLEALQDDLNAQNTTANVLFAATGAFALSTAAFYLFEIRGGKSEPNERSVSVGASATGSSAWVGAAWQF